jgi:hypothetical protein
MTTPVMPPYVAFSGFKRFIGCPHFPGARFRVLRDS